MPSSPTNVDTPLEYLSIESIEWPKPIRIQRFRMEDDERKCRHRENQRRFMQRKQAKLRVLRQQTDLLECQLKYLEAVQEEKILRREQHAQLHQILSKTIEGNHFEPLKTSDRRDEADLDSMILDLLLSL